MITLIRWYLMKAKEIKLKLMLYSCLEEGLNYITTNQDDLQKKIVHEIAEIIHNSNQKVNKA